MPRISDKISIKNEALDRRVMLTQEQKDEIRKRAKAHAYRALYGIKGEAISQRILAREYGVSRRLIQFILDDNKYQENLKRRQERGGWKQYYDKEKHATKTKEHRNYKKELYQKGLIK